MVVDQPIWLSDCPERTKISIGCLTKCHFSTKTLFQSDIQKIMVSNYVIQILFTFLGDPVSEPISAISSDLTTAAATAAAGWWAA